MASVCEMVEGDPEFRIAGDMLHYVVGGRARCMSICTFRVWIDAGRLLLNEYDAANRTVRHLRLRPSDGHAASLSGV